MDNSHSPLQSISNNVSVIDFPQSSIVNRTNNFGSSFVQTDQERFFRAILDSDPIIVMEYLINPSYRPWEWVEKEGYNALHRSAFLDLTSIGKLILKEVKNRIENEITGTNDPRDADQFIKDFVNQPSPNGFRPIHFASYRGNIEFITILINSGADIDSGNIKGINVMHMAAQGNQPRSLIFFREKYNFPLDSIDKDGNTVLHWSCYLGSENMLDYLLSYEDEIGKLINTGNNQGLTPMHLSITSENTKIIKKLFYSGARGDIIDKKLRTPYRLAVEKNKENIAAMLKDVDSPSYLFSYTNNKVCNIRPGLSKIERSSFNFNFFIISHLISESLIFFVIIPFIGSNVLPWIYLSSFIILIVLFLSLSFSNPGYTCNDRSSKSERRRRLLNLVESYVIIDDFCPVCAAVITKYVKHCNYCKKCVDKFDHHCYWANICVGGNNLWIFIIFITWVLINFLLNIYITFNGVVFNNRYGGVDNENIKESISNLKSNKVNDYMISFPYKIKFFSQLHLYDREVKMSISCIMLILFISFFIPILHLWCLNIKNICCRKRKKGYNELKLKNLKEDDQEILISGENNK
jgi:hypothetical protein